MSIPLRTRTCGSHVVVALHADLDVDGAAAAVAACGPRVIVDLSALEFADCHALGALLRVQQAARAIKKEVPDLILMGELVDQATGETLDYDGIHSRSR